MTRAEAFLDRCVLRLFDDSPGLSSYLDRTEVKDDNLIVVFDELPHETIVSMGQSFGVKKVRAFKAAEGPTIKTIFVLNPTEEEMADLSAYPLKDPKDVEADGVYSDDDPDNVPVRVRSSAVDKGSKRLPNGPSRV